MRALQMGWIDYSSEHRDKVMAVLDALSEPGAVDELGIGRIRDGFADRLFPGTSTIQTRAKYFLIVPYLLMELERKSFKNPEEFFELLGYEEVSLIETLKEEGQDGIIGNRAGTTLKRKPSTIYWNGLRTYGIFRHPSLSLSNYIKKTFTMKQLKESTQQNGNEEWDESTADPTNVSTFWNCILPAPDWKETLSMDLTLNEAQFLKSKITTAQASQDSLLAFLLNTDYDKWAHINEFAGLTEVLPQEGPLRQLFEKANAFSQFLQGAHIRYNIIASYGENERAVRKWEQWINSPFVKDILPTFPFKTILRELEIYNARLHLFLEKWQKAVLSGDVNQMDDLIIKREIELKSPNRAKLHNSKMYDYEEGHWIGNDKLNYRYPDAKIILDDIVKGMGEHIAQT